MLPKIRGDGVSLETPSPASPQEEEPKLSDRQRKLARGNNGDRTELQSAWPTVVCSRASPRRITLEPWR